MLKVSAIVLSSLTGHHFQERQARGFIRQPENLKSCNSIIYCIEGKGGTSLTCLMSLVTPVVVSLCTTATALIFLSVSALRICSSLASSAPQPHGTSTHSTCRGVKESAKGLNSPMLFKPYRNDYSAHLALLAFKFLPKLGSVTFALHIATPSVHPRCARDIPI